MRPTETLESRVVIVPPGRVPCQRGRVWKTCDTHIPYFYPSRKYVSGALSLLGIRQSALGASLEALGKGGGSLARLARSRALSALTGAHCRLAMYAFQTTAKARVANQNGYASIDLPAHACSVQIVYTSLYMHIYIYICRYIEVCVCVHL